MFQYDFAIFYSGGAAVLAGYSPYAHWDFNGPYPLALFFAPLALLPEQIAYFVFVAINLGLLWKVVGKRGFWALISFPVFFALLVGQVDVLLAMMGALGSPWLLGLAVVKPQVAFVLLPWFWGRFSVKQWAQVAMVGGGLVVLSFLLRPTWVQEWLAASPGFVFFGSHSSNFYWLVPQSWGMARAVVTIIGAGIALLLAFRIANRKENWSLLHLFAPLTNIYSPAVLAEWIGPLEAALSWLAILLVGGQVHSGAPLFVVASSILIKSKYIRKGAAETHV